MIDEKNTIRKTRFFIKKKLDKPIIKSKYRKQY